MIKLPQAEPQMPPMDAPMEQPPMQGAPQPPMPQDNQMPPMDGGQGQFDTNFDAGVEANEEEDPKKFIQQLTGKLSQSLRSYNENLPQPDADLNKYVAGMIVKQTVDGLSGEERQEILDKVEDDAEEAPEEPMPQDGGQQMPPQEQMPPANESRQSSIKEMVNEIFTDILKGDDDSAKRVEDRGSKDSYRQRAFRAPSFSKK